MERPLKELLKIGGRIANLPIPLVAKPPHVFLNGVDELLTLFFRVCVIKSKMAPPPKLIGQAEIHRNGFGVANMQIAVGLRREPRHDRADATRL